MKKVIALIFFITLLNCNNDDNNSSNETFLEIYQGTIWVENRGNYLKYTRFNNNLDYPIEIWTWALDITDDCFLYTQLNISDPFFSDFSSLEISRNNGNEFEYILILPCMNGEETEVVYTYTITDDILEIRENIFECNSNYSSTADIYRKIDFDVDGITVCE